LILFIIAALIPNGMCDEYGPPLPGDDYIENAAEFYYQDLKYNTYLDWVDDLVGYEIRKVHRISEYPDEVCIENGVIFIGRWEAGSYGAENIGDFPLARLIYITEDGESGWLFEGGDKQTAIAKLYNRPGWFTKPEWGLTVYSSWCYPKGSDGGIDGNSDGDQDGWSDGIEDGIPIYGGLEGFPFETIVGFTVAAAVIAGVGLFVKSIVAGKKADSMAKASARSAPKPAAPAQAAPQVQTAQQPYSEIEPTVRRWIENNPIYPGYWYVTADGKYVSNEINPEYKIPVEWIKGTSSEPLSELFSTPVPDMEHSLHSTRMAALIKRTKPELLDKLTEGSWKKLDESQRRYILQNFVDTIAQQLKVPSVKLEFDPNLDYPGIYDGGSGTPRIQIKSSGNMWDSPFHSVGIITHELQHYLQHVAPEKLVGATKKYIDVIKKNADNYIQHKVDPVRYAGQLYERDAESIGKHMREKISRSAYQHKFEKLVEAVWDKEGLKILDKLDRQAAQQKLDRIFDSIFGKEGANILRR